MTARADHAAEAQRIMAAGERAAANARDAAHNGAHKIADGYGAKAHGCWMQAQVHATLALVEQQRIANLIALATSAGSPVLDRAAQRALQRANSEDYSLEVAPGIREALGLS